MSAGRRPDRTRLSFRRIADVPFGTYVAALESWQLTGPDGRRHTGQGLVCGPVEHDRDSGTCRVRVRLARSARRVILEVGDDGHGFTPQAPSGGVGLASMRERATAAAGTLTIKSGGTGTLVRMTVPVLTPAGGEQCPSAC